MYFMSLSSISTGVMGALSHPHHLTLLMTVLNGQHGLDHRTVYRGHQRKTEYLISWIGYGDEHNTWEPAKNVSNSAELVQDYWLTVQLIVDLLPWL